MNENRSGFWLTLLILAAVVWFFLRPGESKPPEPRDSSTEEANAEISQETSESPKPIATPMDTTSSTPTPNVDTTPKLKPLSTEEIADRRQQVKSALGTIYVAMRAYRAEYDRYSSDLMEIGYQPNPGVLKFKIGFASPYNPFMRNANEDPSRSTTDTYVNISGTISDKSFSYDDYSRDLNLSDLGRLCRFGGAVTDERFEVVAAFNLDDDSTYDVWTIDENKNLTHVVDDTIQ